MALTCMLPLEAVDSTKSVSEYPESDDDDNVASIFDLLNFKVGKREPTDHNYYCDSCAENAFNKFEWTQSLKQIEDLECENSELKTQLLDRDEQCLKLQNRVEELLGDIQEHVKKHSDLTMENENIRKSGQKYYTKLQRVGTQVKKLKQEKRAKDELAKGLEKDLKSIAEQQNQQHTLELTVISLQAKIQEWEQQCAAYQQEIASLTTGLARENSEKQMLTAELAKRYNEKQRLLNDLAKRNAEFQSLSAYSGSNGNAAENQKLFELKYQNVMTYMHTEIVNWEQKFLEEQGKNEKLEGCLSEIKIENEKLTDELRRKNNKIQNLTAELIRENGEHRKLAVDFAAKNNENQELTTDLAWKNGEIDRLSAELFEENVENQRLTSELDQKNSENERLVLELNQEKDETQKLIGKLEEEESEKRKVADLWQRLNEFVKSCNDDLEIQIKSFVKDYQINISVDNVVFNDESGDNIEEETQLKKNLNMLSLLIQHTLQETLLGGNKTSELENEQGSSSSPSCTFYSASSSSLLCGSSRKRSFDFSSNGDPIYDDNYSSGDTATPPAGEVESNSSLAYSSAVEEDAEHQERDPYLPVCSPVSSEDSF